MTDTTNSNTSSEAAKPKVKKPKGPIRTGAVAPFLIFFALVWAYFFFFFDTHLRHGLEYVATNGNGAEVDIARVHTSFWSASLEIDKIEVNLIQFVPQELAKTRKLIWNAKEPVGPSDPQ